MTDYKRVVSYMYNYMDGTKKENIGYARVEARNGQCKIIIHINAPSVNNQVLKVYIFYRKQGYMEPIVLGDMRIRNGMGDFRTITRTDSVMDMGIPLEKMGGIIVFYKDEKFYATEWDDEPILLSNLYKESKPNLPENNQIEEIEQVEEAKVIEETEGTEEIEGTEVIEETNITEETCIIKETRDIDQEDEVNVVDELEPVPDIELREVELDENRMSPLATHIFDRYMKIAPFEDKSIVECVRIEPQDIGSFPMEHWVLGNNSFLLHGYYNYRHLIFGRKIEGNKSTYFIGVPGVYGDREMSMAKLFGFEQFKPINERQELNGEFGYWKTNITI